MAKLAIIFAAVIALCPVAFAATNLVCPDFQCPIGSYFYGKFIDPLNPNEENDNPLTWFYFDAGEFGLVHPYINGGVLVNPQAACAQACQSYNQDAKANGLTIATYWMFEQTCDDGPGGQCVCFGAEVCSGPYWSDEWMDDGESELFIELPTNYTTGKLCDPKIVGDPHFTGYDGSHFEFSGLPNKHFAIISDAHVQVNGYFGGRYGRWENRVKAMTWIRKISVMWGHHEAVLSARVSADPSYNDGYLDSITVDGEPLIVSPHGKVTAVNGEFTVAWTGVRTKNGRDFVDVFKVIVKDALELRLVLRPEVKNLRTKDDANIHFGLQVDKAELSTNVHGVLGQTFRPDFATRKSQQKLVYNSLLGVDVVPGDNAEGFLDGVVEDYMVKSLLKTDCKFCRFARGTTIDEETAGAMALAAAAVSDSFVSRKLLADQ